MSHPHTTNGLRKDQIDTYKETGDKELFNVNQQIVETTRCLQAFRQKAQFTDVILCVGDEELPCHKVVLAASSPYFHAMFSSPYKEQQTSHVLLEHMSPWALRRLLDFAYLGVLELSVTTVQDVFTAASLLNYPIAVKSCVRFMEQHVELSNCLGVEALAALHGFDRLAGSARQLAVENFSILIAESSEWPMLPLSSVVSYISSDDLDVPSEQVVWNACMTWIDHNPDTRQAELPTLLSHVRLRHLGPRFLIKQLTDNEYILENHVAQGMIRSCLLPGCDSTSAVCPDRWRDLPPRPATLTRPTLVVLGGLNSCILNCMQSFSPSKTAWFPCPSMPVDSLAWFSVTVVSNVLYVLGGIQTGHIMPTLYAYSPTTGRWTQRAPMPEARARHAAVAVGDTHILVFGGLTLRSRATPGVEVTSVNAANPLMPIDDSSAISLNSLSPGENDATVDATVPTVQLASPILCYEVATDSWSVAGQSAQPRLESRVVVLRRDASMAPTLTLPPHVSSSSLESDQTDVSSNGTFDPTLNASAASGSRWRSSAHAQAKPFTLIEIGGVTKTHPRGTDQVAFYSLHPDGIVHSIGDYIKLPQTMRYVSCALRQETNLIYLFWEETSELSVLDLKRNTLRPLAPLPIPSSDRASRLRCHVGLQWVSDQLYVVGGYSEVVGGDRRPTSPRDDVHCYNPDTNTCCNITGHSSSPLNGCHNCCKVCKSSAIPNFLCRNVTKLGLCAGVVYYSFAEGIWSTSDRSVGPVTKVKHGLLPQAFQFVGNQSMSSKSILEFLMRAGELKHLDRTGWVNNNINRPESVASHMYRMALMTTLVSSSERQRSGVSIERVMKMAIIHDLAECIVGDITPSCGVSHEDKLQRESEYNARDTPEAKMCFDLDKSVAFFIVSQFRNMYRFDMILQAFEYEKALNSPNKLEDFFKSTEVSFHFIDSIKTEEDFIDSFIGQKFRSFEKFDLHLKEYGSRNFVRFVITTSTADKEDKMRLRYTYSSYACCYGPSRKSRSRGFRKSYISTEEMQRNFMAPINLASPVVIDIRDTLVISTYSAV